MGCTAISHCQTITAFVECMPSMYQGTDNHFEIQLFDEEGQPLDLSDFSGIYMHLYTDGFDYASFKWPIYSDDLEKPLIIIQDEDTSGPIDVGIIGFDITSDMSSRFLTGSLYAEIKFKRESDITGGAPTYSTIGCLNIGTIKESLTRNIKFN